MDVRFIDTTFRDGSQSLWAMGITSGMMAAVAPAMDQAGFQAIEVPINPIHFKKFVRDLKEDPWDVVRLVARQLPNTVKTCMTGGVIQSFAAASPQVLGRLFYERLVALGALNRAQLIANTLDQTRNLFPWLVPMFKGLGVEIAVALSYTISPRHTDAYYAEKTREVMRFAPDAIYLKDQGGLLTPERLRTLLPAIMSNAGGVPVELHSHCTTGLAPLCYLEALKLGVRTLHTAVPPLANGSSQPSVFNVAGNARLLGYRPQVDTDVLRPAAERLTAIARREGLPIGAPLAYDQAQFVHQVPGGVISNLRHQLAELRLQHRLNAVLDEVVQVRKELGYPIMITPYSQFVVAQAAINVALGERYRMVIDEIIQFALGRFGHDSGYTWMDQNVKDRVLGVPRAQELARRTIQPASLKEVRERLGGAGLSDEELLLRVIMQGEAEIRDMRAAGPPKRYTDPSPPLQRLLTESSKWERIRFLHVQKGPASLVLGRAPAVMDP